jgi:hypothetical protein
MSEDTAQCEGRQGDSGILLGYTPTQWFADWLAFQGARLDTAEEQRDWILVHFAGKYSVSEEQDKSHRLMKAMIWLCQNQDTVCKVASWTPGTPMPPTMIQVLYMMFGCHEMDSAPPVRPDELQSIFDTILHENMRHGVFQPSVP